MDAKDLRTQSALGERNDDVTKYAQSGSAIQCNRNKSYQDIRSNASSKVDTSTARPCAVIGPDRVVPPVASNDAYVRKAPLEPWPCPDATYHHPPEYPNRTLNYQNLTRNISPRQTFQEDMQRIMVPTSYNSVKINSDNNFTQLSDRNVSMTKNVKINNAADVKYCDVPYTVNQTSSNPKMRADMGVSNVNPVLVRPAPQGWPSSSARPQRAYGAPEMYQFPDYPSCAGPRPAPIPRPHRTVQEEPGHLYSDSYYQESNIRYKPYPNIKERYPQTRYDYTSNYSNPFHPPPPFLPLKYDLSKPMPPHTYPGHPHFKYVNSSRMPDPVPDAYHRPINQQANYNPQFRNQIIHPTYGPMVSNIPQSKVSQYTPDSAMKSIISNKLLYDSNSKMYIDYENAHIKPLHPSDNFYANESSRLHAMKNQVPIPNYPPVNMQSIPAHLLYKKDQQIKHYDYMNHYKNFDPLTNINSPVSRHLPQFSPSTLAISPTDSNTSNDTAHTQSTSLEDFGYVSQSSAASVRSMDSGVHRVPNDYHGRYYDYRYSHVMRTPFIPKSAGNLNSTADSKDKKGINVRQFLQMWNEGDEENAENNSHKEIVLQANADEGSKTSKQTEVVNNQEQLYVLGLVNVPSDELSKYEHIQKISKLPENIKGYNSIELLTQFEEVIESTKLSSYKPYMNKDFQIPYKGLVQATCISPRPVSPLDVEAKISQSVIHKEVGCNFEIKPCSPKMSNVELTAPVRNHLDERLIEKVTNPHSNMIKSPLSSRIDEVLESCKILKRQDLRTHNDADKISSCEMINTKYSNNSSIKTNYSLHDLESNSGLSLASLPRLDNEIELNFPEVNQQFINANKGDSTVTKIQDLPNLEMTDQISFKTPKEALKQEVEINKEVSPSFVTDKEFTKLSKYRKLKMSDGDIKGDNIHQKALRTDSVIIKNPENTKKIDDFHAYSPIHKLSVETQQGPINLTSQNDRKAENKLEIENSHAESSFGNDTAIDFSINKSDDITNVSSKLPVQKSGASFVDTVPVHAKNNEGFTKYTDISKNIPDVQHNSLTNTGFVKDKKKSRKNKNKPKMFNHSEEISPIHERATSDIGDLVDITNFKDVGSLQLNRNIDIPIDSINHESLTDLVDNAISSPISDSNFTNVYTQNNRAMEIEESEKNRESERMLTDIPYSDSDIPSQVDPILQQKEYSKLNNNVELNKSEINNGSCADIEKQCTMQECDREIIEDKNHSDSKEEVHNGNDQRSNLHYESDDKRKICDSQYNIEETVILSDTNSFENEQVSTTIKNINETTNKLAVNHAVPSRETPTNCDVAHTENLKDDKIESCRQFSRCSDEIVTHSTETCSKKIETFDNYQFIPDTYVKVNKSSITSFNKRLCSFSKKLYSPLIQNLIMFNEGMCDLLLPNIKLQSDVLKTTVFSNEFDTYSSSNSDQNTNITEIPFNVPGENIVFSNKVVRYNEDIHHTLLNTNNKSNVEEVVSLKLADMVNTDFSNNYETSLHNVCVTETSVELLHGDTLDGDRNLTNNSDKYDDVKGDPLLVSENIKPCMIKDKRAMRLSDEYDIDYSGKNDTDINTGCETVINIDSLPSSSLNDDHSFSNETGIFEENLHGSLLLNQTEDRSVQDNAYTIPTNPFETESTIYIDKKEKEVTETTKTYEELQLDLSNGDRDLCNKSIICNKPKCEPLIINEKYKCDMTKNKIPVKLPDQFITNTFLDNNKNVIGCKSAEVTVSDPSHLDDNHKLFSNTTKDNDVICGSLFLNESIESANATEKVEDQFVTDSYSGDDQNEKEYSGNIKCVEEIQPNVIDNVEILSCDNIGNHLNKYSQDEVIPISINETKCISREENNVEYSNFNEPVTQQKIPYINEFYDEIGDSDESTSTHFEFTSTINSKKSINDSNLDSIKQDIEPLTINITDQNTLSIDFKDDNTVQDTLEESDMNLNDHDSIAKCDNEDTKNTKCNDCEYSSTSRFSLKRSLSDSALNNLYDDMQEKNDNLAYMWPLKRKKTKHIANSVEPNLIAQNLCRILQSNRRNSISSIYNEENVSFCILIDNNCIITEDNEEEKICYTDLPEECEIEHNFANEDNSDFAEEGQICAEENLDIAEEGQFCAETENCEFSDSLNVEYEQEKSVEDSWVEDIACVETVISEDIAEDVMISTSSSPKDISPSDDEESNIFCCNISEHTNKVKYIYGEKMCNDDAQFVETLYNTPQMDVNKTLSTRESQVLEECNRIYDNESLEKILSESNSRGASPYSSEHHTESLYSAAAYNCSNTPDNKENIDLGNKSPVQSEEQYTNTVNFMAGNNLDQENNNLKVNEKTQDDAVHSCESSIDNVFSYKQKDDNIFYTPSCSPEVSSTTSEEKNTGILLKITNYKGSIISEINGIKSENNRPRCKFTEKKDYANSKLSSHRPLLTKAAQKYIPPLKESIRDLKVKISLPQHSLLKLKQLKVSKDEPKPHKHYSTSPRIPKKPKPKFEDVLLNIDKVQFKMNKEKNKKGKKSIPKVVIKKTENGSHYASTSDKDTYNPDLTGRKWQPWVFLEKNTFIDKMASRGKTKAVYSHRKNTYVLAEKFYKYKSVNTQSTKFVISQPKCSDSSTGQLKYTIRLKHNY